jgi:hypothetical protein
MPCAFAASILATWCFNPPEIPPGYFDVRMVKQVVSGLGFYAAELKNAKERIRNPNDPANAKRKGNPVAQKDDAERQITNLVETMFLCCPHNPVSRFLRVGIQP